MTPRKKLAVNGHPGLPVRVVVLSLSHTRSTDTGDPACLSSLYNVSGIIRRFNMELLETDKV